MIRRLGLAAALAAAAALSGCVSLFPKAEPVTMYKLAAAPRPGPPSPLPDGATISILLGPIAFTRPAAGDRILTTNGLETAYVGGARWVAPASVMFQEDLAAVFDQRPGMSLATRGEAVAADYTMRIEVRTFEAEYNAPSLSGKGKKPPELNAPNVVVEARVTLLDLKHKAVVSEKTFRETKFAGDNRVTAIVRAFDDATGLVMNEIADWTMCTQVHCVEVTTRS
jgi:cholesterol transport system auxiliary component